LIRTTCAKHTANSFVHFGEHAIFLKKFDCLTRTLRHLRHKMEVRVISDVIMYPHVHELFALRKGYAEAEIDRENS